MIGRLFRVSFYGESHGYGVSTLIEGCPPGIRIDEDFISKELGKRRIEDPSISTQRIEKDEFKITSGVFNGYTTGAPISITILNRDVDSRPYETIKNKPRPSHADLTAWIKYHGYNDFRGGGIFSGRLTAAMVAAGAIAKQLIMKYGINVYAFTKSIGNISLNNDVKLDDVVNNTYSNPARCPDPETASKMIELIKETRAKGDSIGGVVEAWVTNVPPGLGDPPIDTLDGDIAKAVFTIPGVKAIEFGKGFDIARMTGSEANDPIALKDGKIITLSNNSGGINGGISNGMPIIFRVAFKPTPSIYIPQKTIDLRHMRETMIRLWGRFDPCIAIRAPPIIESITAIVIADHLLRWLAWEKYLEEK